MPRRGEVWWVRLDPTVGSGIAKTRPCIVLSTNVLNERRRTVIVVPLSSLPSPSPPLLIPVRCANRDGIAVIDQIRVVSKDRLDRCMGQLSGSDLAMVEEGLREILELP